MTSWAAYLRGQADARKLTVIETTTLTVDEVADELEALLRALTREEGGLDEARFLIL
jgi:hypothetical protein